MIELAGLKAADAKIHSDLRAFTARENGWPEHFEPPDLCCQKLETAARGLLSGNANLSVRN